MRILKEGKANITYMHMHTYMYYCTSIDETVPFSDLLPWLLRAVVDGVGDEVVDKDNGLNERDTDGGGHGGGVA